MIQAQAAGRERGEDALPLRFQELLRERVEVGKVIGPVQTIEGKEQGLPGLRDKTRRRDLSGGRQLRFGSETKPVDDDSAVVHHEEHVLELARALERISLDGDEVRFEARPQLSRPQAVSASISC